MSEEVEQNYHVFSIGSNNGVDIYEISDKFTFFNAKWYHFWVYWKIALMVVKMNPDLIITSLWRSHLIGILIKLMNHKSKVVCFIHNSRFVHFFDGLVTRIYLKFCDLVLTDSNSAKSFVEEYISKNKTKISVIDLIFPVQKSLVSRGFNKREINRLIFVGRVSKQKNLHGCIRFLSELHKKGLYFHYDIYGQDEGLKEELIKLAQEIGILDYVHFYGAVGFFDVQPLLSRYRFMLQLSFFEGFGMSVVESLQVGTIPIVTPVGESISYCSNDINSILVTESLIEAVERIALLSEQDVFDMSEAAKITFCSVDYFPTAFTNYISSC
ncbi:glycosyltransferase [Vibrio splendidus]